MITQNVRRMPLRAIQYSRMILTAALKMKSHFSFDAELIDPLRDACELTKCVLPYRSTIPFAVRYTYPSYMDPMP